ncbi:MAG: hypothetical protein J07AB43_15730 [Candidatus Nanosalina sp. J07AB43]|jgi:hypothetical protein|nr:MAG: hypothetical protein J07AB43_15730 [Candidatus Nanosalina sp. J07AB43]
MAFLYSVSVLGALMLAYRIVPGTGKPGFFTFVIVFLGANIGGLIGSKIHGRPLDELDSELFNRSMVHGFVVLFSLVGYQALTESFLTPVEETIFASAAVLISMTAQFVFYNYDIGDLA